MDSINERRKRTRTALMYERCKYCKGKYLKSYLSKASCDCGEPTYVYFCVCSDFMCQMKFERESKSVCACGNAELDNMKKPYRRLTFDYRCCTK